MKPNQWTTRLEKILFSSKIACAYGYFLNLFFISSISTFCLKFLRAQVCVVVVFVLFTLVFLAFAGFCTANMIVVDRDHRHVHCDHFGHCGHYDHRDLHHVQPVQLFRLALFALPRVVAYSLPTVSLVPVLWSQSERINNFRLEFPESISNDELFTCSGVNGNQ